MAMDKKSFYNRIHDCIISEQDVLNDLQKLVDKGALSDEEIEKMPDNYLPICTNPQSDYMCKPREVNEKL